MTLHEYLPNDMNDDDIKKHIDFTNYLIAVVKNNDIQKVEALLMSSEIGCNTDHLGVLQVACTHGSLPVVEYLLCSSPFPKVTVKQMETPFAKACTNGHLSIVEFFMSSPKLDIHMDINVSDAFTIRILAEQNKIDMLKYLLTHSSSKPDIHAKQDEAFRSAVNGKHWDMVNYLIFDYRIVKTESIREFIELGNLKNIKSLFAKRELNDNLNKDLPSKDEDSGKMKI